MLAEVQAKDAASLWRVDHAMELLESGTSELTEWDEEIIRQLVDTVKVISKEKILVILRGGIQFEQDMIQ